MLNRRKFMYGCGGAAASVLIGCDSTLRPRDALDDFIGDEMARNHIPGLAVSVVRGGTQTWAKGYGWADIERQVAMTTSTTIFHSRFAIPATPMSRSQSCSCSRIIHRLPMAPAMGAVTNAAVQMFRYRIGSKVISCPAVSSSMRRKISTRGHQAKNTSTTT